MLESNSTARYINGWNEPDLVLSIYHTIDREEDRVKCFFLGNNTSFYNPYHIHPAFAIPEIRPGEIWTSENVLFQWAVPSDSLKESRKDCKFLRMLNNTNYGRYSMEGEYIEDNENFVRERPTMAKFVFAIEFNNNMYGVWLDSKKGYVYIDKKWDKSTKLIYTINMKDHNENTVLSKNAPLVKWLIKQFKMGTVRFSSVAIKKQAEMFFSALI